MTYALAIHGGAGPIPGGDFAPQTEHLQMLIAKGHAMLRDKCTALDIVCEMVKDLEASGLYMAGRGCSPNLAGTFELDASIMNGSDQQCGAVASIQRIKHPILAARAVMEKTEHITLAGMGAQKFAIEQGLDTISDPTAYYTLRDDPSTVGKNHGTVGAVALDDFGNLAAATSTGGTYSKMEGRVGDTPIIGSGTWADKNIAVSCTGLGEFFCRTNAAYAIAAKMQFAKMALGDACTDTLDDIATMGGDGGLIAITHDGKIAMPYNSHGMRRASVSSTQHEFVRIFA